jgi:hypothetical protein
MLDGVVRREIVGFGKVEMKELCMIIPLGKEPLKNIDPKVSASGFSTSLTY